VHAACLFLVVFLGSVFYHGLGITIGYHRLLSHRSFKVPRWLEYVLVSGAYLCFEGSPIFWVSNHRLHHRFSDQPGDPHSPKDGLWHCFLGWMFKPTVTVGAEDMERLCPDLYRDAVYRLLQFAGTPWDGLLCLASSVLFRVVLFVFGGPLVLAANVVGSAIAFVSPLLVNSICHIPRFGYRSYEAGDDSRNVLWVGILALGEGWHNNHHAFPQSARHGLEPAEFDFSWLCISALKKVGLAKEIRLPKDRESKRLVLPTAHR